VKTYISPDNGVERFHITYDAFWAAVRGAARNMQQDKVWRATEMREMREQVRPTRREMAMTFALRIMETDLDYWWDAHEADDRPYSERVATEAVALTDALLARLGKEDQGDE
jgi:hypothetical protein